MPNTDTYSINNKDGILRGCIDLVESPDDGGWYAQEYNFKRFKHNDATRTSKNIFRTRIRDRLQHGRLACAKMSDWLRKYDQD